MRNVCSCHKLLSYGTKRVHRAKYEESVLTLSSAYAGSHFDLPAFIYFRGRIYHAGVLHFHEGFYCLILFANAKQLEQR